MLGFGQRGLAVNANGKYILKQILIANNKFKQGKCGKKYSPDTEERRTAALASWSANTYNQLFLDHCNEQRNILILENGN